MMATESASESQDEATTTSNTLIPAISAGAICLFVSYMSMLFLAVDVNPLEAMGSSATAAQFAVLLAVVGIGSTLTFFLVLTTSTS